MARFALLLPRIVLSMFTYYLLSCIDHEFQDQ